jgi:hypothetical protein
MVWKFQPPSGKDSQKRSATRHKNPQSRDESQSRKYMLAARFTPFDPNRTHRNGPPRRRQSDFAAAI